MFLVCNVFSAHLIPFTHMFFEKFVYLVFEIPELNYFKKLLIFSFSWLLESNHIFSVSTDNILIQIFIMFYPEYHTNLLNDPSVSILCALETILEWPF